ncbi:MAG: hypothetical protein ACLQRH_27285 [Acidimicrobiales bacterium]
MERGDVYLVSVDLPNRTTGVGTVPVDKYVVVLRGGLIAATETEVPVVVASTDRRTPSRGLRPFEVSVGTAEGFAHPTVIDCRWPYTLEKAWLMQGNFRFQLPSATVASQSWCKRLGAKAPC